MLGLIRCLAQVPPELQEQLREIETQFPAEAEGYMALLGGTMLLLWLAIYVYTCLSLHIIAKKTNTGPAFLAWIPIA